MNKSTIKPLDQDNHSTTRHTKILAVIMIILTIIVIALVFCFVVMGYNNYKLNSSIKSLNSEIIELKMNIETITVELDKQKNIDEHGETTEESTKDLKEIASEKDIYERLLEGDFSGISGEYVNGHGDIIVLTANGVHSGDRVYKADSQTKNSEGSYSVSIPRKTSYGSYKWDLHYYDKNGDPGGGHYAELYPVGVTARESGYYTFADDDPNWIDEDISKIRYHEGQDIASDEAIIYYKK